jgi:C-terminal processing protease CtpA/Prc
MIGELNASHLGMNPPPNPTFTTGRLGVRFDREEYARSGRLAVARVIPLGPAAVTGALAPGDVIAAVNGTPVTRETNLDRLRARRVRAQTLPEHDVAWPRDRTARTMLGQRALESPTILVTNQHSLSDAEDFTEGYRRLKLGKVVGEPTAGWIIYTWNARLVDGSVLRLPRVRITDADGKDMERMPRPVDVPAVRQPGEAAAGRDSQLDAAVHELLKQLGARQTTESR